MKKKILLLSVLLIVLVLPTMVFADSFKFNMKLEQTAEPKVYKENDEVKIDLKISDINVGDLGINIVEGTLEYDEDLFEVVSTSSFKGKNEWSFTFNDEKTGVKGKFLGMVLSNGIKEEQEIATITLKVRNEVKKSATSTEIKIKDIKTNNGVDIVKTDDQVVQIPLQVEYKQGNPVTFIIVVVAIIAIILGLVAILRKKSK